MSILVTDTGFGDDDWLAPFLRVEELAANIAMGRKPAVSIDGSDDLSPLLPLLGSIAMVRVEFPAFGDGRGLTLAARLRRAGFTGRLRAAGPLLPDQYAMIRRVGFDEVEIPSDHAARHRETFWIARADWQTHDHRAPMRQNA